MARHSRNGRGDFAGEQTPHGPAREYDWIDDPFREQKAQTGMSGGSKALIGVGCLVVVVLIAAMIFVAVAGVLSIASSSA